MVAAMLHAERVGDVDVAAPPGTATAAANWDGGCRGPRHPTAGRAMAIYRAGCKRLIYRLKIVRWSSGMISAQIAKRFWPTGSRLIGYYCAVLLCVMLHAHAAVSPQRAGY